MGNSVGDILKTKVVKDEPPEFSIIKNFVSENYQEVPTLSLSNNHIIISVSSSGLAGSLRLRLPELMEIAQTKRRLIIRIG